MNNLIIVFGVFLIAVGTLLTYWGADRKNKETNAGLQQSITSKNQQIDELVEGKNTLITQNDELKKKIEAYQNELDGKQKKIEELEEIAGKDIYKPLDPSIQSQIIHNLSSIQESIKEVIIDLFDVDNNGKRVGSDLLAILNKAGVKAKIGATGVTFGKSTSRPSIKMNSNSKGVAQQIAMNLFPYLRTQFAGGIDDSLEDGVIHIQINGIVLFHKDGSVEFQ